MEDHEAHTRSPLRRLVRINRARPAAVGGRAAPEESGVLLLSVRRPFRLGDAIGNGVHLVEEGESTMDMLFSFENQVGAAPLVREGMSTRQVLASFENRFGNAHLVEETGIFVDDEWCPSENHDSTPVVVTERFRTLPLDDGDVVYEQVVAAASDGGVVAADDDASIAKKEIEHLSKLSLVKIGQLQERCKVRVRVMVEDVKKDMVDVDLGRRKGREIEVRDETGSVTFIANCDQIEKCEKEAFLELQGAELVDSKLVVPNYPYGRIEVIMPPVEPKKQEELGLLDQLIKDLEELPLVTIDQEQGGTKVKVKVRVEKVVKDKYLKIHGKKGAAQETKVCDETGSVLFVAINDQIEKCEREAVLELQGAFLRDSMLLVPSYPYGRIKVTTPPVQLQEHDDNTIHEVPLMKIKQLAEGMTGVRLRAKVIRNKARYGQGVYLADETQRLHFSPLAEQAEACRRNALIEVEGGSVCIENQILKLKLGNHGRIAEIFPPLFTKGSEEENMETSQQDKVADKKDDAGVKSQNRKKRERRLRKVADKKDGAGGEERARNKGDEGSGSRNTGKKNDAGGKKRARNEGYEGSKKADVMTVNQPPNQNETTSSRNTGNVGFDTGSNLPGLKCALLLLCVACAIFGMVFVYFSLDA